MDLIKYVLKFVFDWIWPILLINLINMSKTLCFLLTQLQYLHIQKTELTNKVIKARFS